MVLCKTFTAAAYRVAVFLIASMLCGGCTTFHHDWEVASHQSVPATELKGRWEGFWLSDANAHTGKLRCVISQKEDGDYRARFHAKYGKVFSFGYTVTLKVEPLGDSYKFQGQANLGWLAGGVYSYEGHADQTNFFSTYSSKYDHGTFQMTRP
jgi:hypothetical protein